MMIFSAEETIENGETFLTVLKLVRDDIASLSVMRWQL